MNPLYPLTAHEFHDQVVYELDKRQKEETEPINQNHWILDIFLTHAYQLGYQVPNLHNIIDDPSGKPLLEIVTAFVNTDLATSFVASLLDDDSRSPNRIAQINLFAELLHLTLQSIPLPQAYDLRELVILAPSTVLLSRLITCQSLSMTQELHQVMRLYDEIISPNTNMCALNRILPELDVVELALMACRSECHYSAIALNALAYISLLDTSVIVMEFLLDYVDHFMDILLTNPPFGLMTAIIRFVYFLSLRPEFMDMDDVWISRYLCYCTGMMDLDSEPLPYLVGTVYNISQHILAGLDTHLSLCKIHEHFCSLIVSSFSYDTLMEFDLPRDMAYLTDSADLADLVTKLMDKSEPQ